FMHDVLSVHNDRRILWRTQGRVQDRSLLCDVDLVPTKHGVDSRSQARLPGELKKQFEGFIGNAVLRVIEVQVYSLDRHTLTALRVVCKTLTQIELGNGLVVRREYLPRR